MQAVRRRTEETDKDFGDFNWKEHSEKEQRQLDEMKKLSKKPQSNVGHSELSKEHASMNVQDEDQATASSSTMDSESSSSLTSTTATEGATCSESESGTLSSRVYLNAATVKFQKFADKVEKKSKDENR